MQHTTCLMMIITVCSYPTKERTNATQTNSHVPPERELVLACMCIGKGRHRDGGWGRQQQKKRSKTKMSMQWEKSDTRTTTTSTTTAARKGIKQRARVQTHKILKADVKFILKNCQKIYSYRLIFLCFLQRSSNVNAATQHQQHIVDTLFLFI